MANGKLNLGKQSGGELALVIPDGVSNTEVIVPESGKLASVDGSVTDNAIARYDGTTGKLQDSAVTVTDSGNILIGTTTDNGIDKLQIYGTISATAKMFSDFNSAYRLINGCVEEWSSSYAPQNRPGVQNWLFCTTKTRLVSVDSWRIIQIAENIAGNIFTRVGIGGAARESITWSPWVEK